MIMFFILCFVVMHHFTKDLVLNTKVYALRMMLFCLVFYALFNQIEVLI